MGPILQIGIQQDGHVIASLREPFHELEATDMAASAYFVVEKNAYNIHETRASL